MTLLSLDKKESDELVKDLEKLSRRVSTPDFIFPVINDQGCKRLYYTAPSSLGVAVDLRSLLSMHGSMAVVPDDRPLDAFARHLVLNAYSRVVQGVECLIVGSLVLLTKESSVKHCYEIFDYRVMTNKFKLGMKEVASEVFCDA